jgi:hypothetical protein
MPQSLNTRTGPAFTIEAALAARDQGRFPSWVDMFLRGLGNNIPLADGLLRERRWWLGPVELPLADLVLKCGPGLEFHEDEARYDARVQALAGEIRQGLKVPPLIAEYREGTLLLADGNHRHGGLERCGVSRYWTAVWFNSEADFEWYSKGR